MKKISFLEDKKILIIAPHPDDEAICCGGLIMLAKKQNVPVFVIYMAIGTSRQFISKKTTPLERIPELKKAAKYGNFEYKVAFQGKEFMQLDFLPQKKLIEIIEDISKEFKPNIVCTPFQKSFNQDHRAVANASATAFRPLPREICHQPEIILECEEPYLWPTQEAFTPNVFFDISDVFEGKINLLKKHSSQLRKDPFPRSPENLRRFAGIRGCEISTKYAEAYRLLKGQFI